MYVCIAGGLRCRTSDSFSLILRSSGDMGGHISRDIVA